MTRRRWIADEVSGNRAVLLGSHAEHLARVLRACIGQEFDISTGNQVRRGRIVSVSPERVEFELGEGVSASDALPVTLALSIFKFDRMEWAIEKCTELGAARIVPVIARRTESHLAAAASKRVERWRRIGREAAQQCRRVSVPEISDPMRFKDVSALSGSTRIVLSEVERQRSLKNALQASSKDDLVLAFGPEGGWTQEELQTFQEAGWISASLGHTILRAETAAIAAMAIVAAEFA
ncbi:MAG: 16S rRNA (uracil(1498)-N(3))-methyltransferase [Acidobacteriaceae bacterium]|nr:16S rRNA (uracil(1498)-N(3))-methyltransferase [Acidobacteriaceae bacterium]